MATTDTQAAPSNLGKKVKRYFILFLLVLILGGSGITYLMSSYCYSSGERTGSVRKFSHKGYVFKTWEGELYGSDFQTSQQTAFNFSVMDENTANKIEQAMRTNDKVVLKYCEKKFKFPWQGDTYYFIENINIVK